MLSISLSLWKRIWLLSANGWQWLEMCNKKERIKYPNLFFLKVNQSSIFQVCQIFNKCCEQLLNSGFSKIDKLHAQIQKQVKSQLPRRESERRNHPLARHVDILSAIETRLSLLGMTYMRYIDMGLCCFIPGKVKWHIFAHTRTEISVGKTLWFSLKICLNISFLERGSKKKRFIEM